MLAIVVSLQSWFLSFHSAGGRSRRSDERGQASAEYALVLLGAAAVALLVTTWATRTDRLGRLLDAVLDSILARAR